MKAAVWGTSYRSERNHVILDLDRCRRFMFGDSQGEIEETEK